MISHIEAQALISSRLDQPLDPIADRALSDHLALCSECRAFAHAADTLAMGLRELPYLPASPTVSRGVMARIEQGRSPWARFGGLLDINPMPALSTFAVVAVLFLLGFFVLDRFVLDNEGNGPGEQQLAVQPTAQPTQSLDFVVSGTPTPTHTPAPTATTAPTETTAPEPTATSAPMETATTAPTPEPTATTAAPTETPAPEPTATTPPPTETPAPTATTPPPTETPAPTATVPPPTETPAPTATTPPPTEAPAPTATNAPTEEPETMQAQGGADDEVVDLTGEASTQTEKETTALAPTATATATTAPTPEPTATTEPTPEPTSTAEPTPEPTATATTAPTPEPTATVAPTETPAPTATPEPTPAPSPTPEPTEEVAPPIVPIDGSEPIDAPEDAATDAPEELPAGRGSAGGDEARTDDPEARSAIEPIGDAPADEETSTDEPAPTPTATATSAPAAIETDTGSARIEPIGETATDQETEQGTDTATDTASETVVEIEAATEVETGTDAATETESETEEAQTPVVEDQSTDDVRDLDAASQAYGDIAGDPAGRLLLEDGRMEYGALPHAASLVTPGGYEATVQPVEGSDSVAICAPGAECTPLSHRSADGAVVDQPLGWVGGGVVYARETADGVTYRFLLPTDDGSDVVSDEALYSGGAGEAPTSPVYRTDDRLWVITADGSWLALGPGGGQDLGNGASGATLLRFAPTSERLLLGYVQNGVLNIADAAQPASPFLRLPFNGADFDIAPGGQQVVVSEGNAIAIYDISGTLVTRYESATAQPGTVLWLNSGIVYHDNASGVLMTIPETAR